MFEILFRYHQYLTLHHTSSLIGAVKAFLWIGCKALSRRLAEWLIYVTRLLGSLRMSRYMSRYETKTLKRQRVLNRYRRKDTVHSSPSGVSPCNSIASRAVCDMVSRFVLAFRFTRQPSLRKAVYF